PPGPGGLSPGEKLARRQLGKRLTLHAFKKAGEWITNKMFLGSREWLKAYEHIAEHFSERALQEKAKHSVFAKPYRNRAGLEKLLNKGAKPGAKRWVTCEKVHGNPVGRPVVILEREFAEPIGESLKKVGENIERRPARILRIIVDTTGDPVTSYPVFEHFN